MAIGHSHLRAFHTVATARGFSAAARQLRLSQPTVSTLVKDLEQHFSVRLFVRAGRSVSLTELGERLLRITRRYFEAENEALMLLAEDGALRTGLLRVAAVGPYDAVDMLAAFKRRYPAVTLDVKIGDSQEVLERVQRYDCEIGVLAQIDDDESLAVFDYSDHEVVLIVPQGHRLGGREHLRLGELVGEPLIMREPGSNTRRAVDLVFRERGFIPLIGMQIGSRETIREAVAQGLGIAFVSEREHIPDSRIRVLHLADVTITTNTKLICLKERLDSQLVGAFLQVARDLRAQLS